jgi:hypothetical protein
VAIAMASAQATAAAAAPAYVTAWPRQVEVLQPDPVLGDKPYFEHWVYSRAFAERFRGTTDGQTFTPEQADPELEGRKLYALVLRIYKNKLWRSIPDYPEQYGCEIELYFDPQIRIPETAKRMPPGRSDMALRPKEKPGPHFLLAYDPRDEEAIRQSRSSEFYLARQAVLFTLPPDGRRAPLGGHDYRPTLAPGLAFVRLIAVSFTNDCKIATPLHPAGGESWLSLTGIDPYLEQRTHGTYSPRFETLSFDPGPDPESRGLFRIPRAFHAVALEKAALVKVMNWCIWARHAHAHPHPRSNMTEEVWKRMEFRCEQAERHGRILPDPRYHPHADRLMETGY